MIIDHAELRQHLLTWARRWTRQEADAQDVAQRVLLRAIAGGALPDGRASLRTWAYRAAKNDCHAYYAPQEQKRGYIEDMETFVLIDRRTPEAAAIAEQGLREASQYTEAVLMALGYDYDTIAEQQGIPVGTVQRRMK